jgi:hypothetical protein
VVERRDAGDLRALAQAGDGRVSLASILAVMAVVLVPGAGATFAAFRPGMLGVEAAIALTFGLGYAAVGFTAVALAIVGAIGETSFSAAMIAVTAAVWAVAIRLGRPSAHLRALATDIRRRRWELTPGLVGLTAFALDKLRLEPVAFISTPTAWRYWADGLEILRAGGVPATSLQWGMELPTTVSKVLLNSFEAGMFSVAPGGTLATMGAFVWLGGVGLFAGLLAVSRELGLRVLAVAVPMVVLATPGWFPISLEFARDANVFRVETLGRMVVVCALLVALPVIRGRAGLWYAVLAGALLGAAAGTHLIPVMVLGIFLAWYTLGSLVIRRGRLGRIARAAGVTALVTVAIWGTVLVSSGGDLGFQGARSTGGYSGASAGVDPTKAFELFRHKHISDSHNGWVIPPARVAEVAVASFFTETPAVDVPSVEYAGAAVLAAAAAVVVWRRRRTLGVLVLACWATAFTLVLVGLYFSHRYRTHIPGNFGRRRLFEYEILLGVLVGAAGLSYAVRVCAARAGPGRRSMLRKLGPLLLAAIAVVFAAIQPLQRATPEERNGFAVMATVARAVPCDARMLVNVRTAGSFEVLSRRISVDEGMAPYLRPAVLRRVVPIVQGARRFFHDPAAHRAFLERLHVDVVVLVTHAAVGGQPVTHRGRRGVLDAVPWLDPLVRTTTVTIYATPSFADGPRSGCEVGVDR